MLWMGGAMSFISVSSLGVSHCKDLARWTDFEDWSTASVTANSPDHSICPMTRLPGNTSRYPDGMNLVVSLHTLLSMTGGIP